MPRTFRSQSLAVRACLLRSNLCLPASGATTRDYRAVLAELRSDLRKALDDLRAHEKEVARPVELARALALDELEEGLTDILRQVQRAKRKR
jgi:hypothetical protein